MSLNSISDLKFIFVNKIEISTLSHATESLDYVEKAVRNIIPNKDLTVKIEMKKLKGHYDDPIFLLKAKVNNKKVAGTVFHNILKKISMIGKKEVLEELENRLDKVGNFYLRLDKQKAFEGKIVLNDVDPIRLKFYFKNSKGKKVSSSIRSYIKTVIEEGE